jgi:hypothetical protein
MQSGTLINYSESSLVDHFYGYTARLEVAARALNGHHPAIDSPYYLTFAILRPAESASSDAF